MDEFGEMAGYFGLDVDVLRYEVDALLVEVHSDEVIIVKHKTKTNQKRNPTHFTLATPSILSPQLLFLFQLLLNLRSRLFLRWSFAEAQNPTTVIAGSDGDAIWNGGKEGVFTLTVGQEGLAYGVKTVD